MKMRCHFSSLNSGDIFLKDNIQCWKIYSKVDT